jgi:RNA polymerase sigma-70 factor (ECF subfamily)
MSASKVDAAPGLRGAVSALSIDAPWSAPDLPPQDVVLRLFDQCAPRLLRYVQAFGIQPDSAEDIVQDVFLALFHHLARGRSRQNLRGWVFRVAHNLALKHRQRVRARESGALALQPPLELRIEASAGPEELLVEDQRRRRLQAAYDALPERDRRCVFLRAEGFRYRDIARIVGVSLGTVASTLARALSRLEVVNDQ